MEPNIFIFSIQFICIDSYTLVEPKDQKWGDNLDGSWTGLVGQLYRKVNQSEG